MPSLAIMFFIAFVITIVMSAMFWWLIGAWAPSVTMLVTGSFAFLIGAPSAMGTNPPQVITDLMITGMSLAIAGATACYLCYKASSPAVRESSDNDY